MLLAEPEFTGYRRAANASDSEIVCYQMTEENDFEIKDDILDLLSDDIDMIFLANPNNPTGRITDRTLLEKIIERCLKNNILVLVDECFMTLSGRMSSDSFIGKADVFPNLCIIRSFTKTYAMPGLRLGYLVSSDGNFREKITASLGEWNISIPAGEAGLAALKEDEYLKDSIDFIKNERKWLVEELKKKAYNVICSDADFVLFRSDRGLYKRLLDEGILIRKCSDYPGLDDGWFRVAVRSHEDNMLLISKLGDVQ